MKYLLSTFLVATTSASVIAQTNVLSPEVETTARQLMAEALDSDLAWEIVESLTTEVGPRLGGSEAEARAREWGRELGEELGFDRISVEEFELPFWERGDMSITMTAPYQQALYGTALGGSGASPQNGELEAEIAYFRTVDDLVAVEDSSLIGRIAFVDGDAIVPSQNGEGYGPANQRRRIGWQHAQRAGAEALVVRSVGSDSHRFPHTGMMTAQGSEWAEIPVIAVSNPDADHLRRLHAGGNSIRLDVHSTAGWQGERTSGNVVLDLIGREKPEEIVLIGGHLDSWDLGTGAVDDGAGIAITTAAATLIGRLPQRPRRTIRVVMFGAEEVGLVGAQDYARVHAAELANHQVATESDFGAGNIWQLASNVSEAGTLAVDAIGKIIAPLGIIRGGSDVPGSGPDISPMAARGVPTINLRQNGTDYFDLHHTPDDTLDKIDPDQLAQNVAAYVVFAYLAAELDVQFRE
ncbi:MAG: M28 family peptidase [Pseudomonadales bacterium]|nr:M28 family peptidase [Pseudomonadales bacterium]